MASVRGAWGLGLLAAASLSAVPGAAGAYGAVHDPKHHLDGRVFIVEKGVMGKTAAGKDTLLFRNGMFLSRYCEKHYGFSEGPYTSEKEGDTIRFVARIRSESHGTIRWEGEVQDGKADVRYTWTDRRPRWYEAEAKPTEHWARSVTTWATDDPGPPGGGAVSHLLDGKTFLVQTGEKGKEIDHDDYLVFQDGTFVSTDCVESLDFRQSAYSATPHGNGIRFRVETTSPKHGTMIWDGIVRGDTVEAEARWIYGRWYWTIDRIYWFRGKLRE